MTDKYQKLRNDLAAALADAEQQGGVNERAEQIAALLAERDALAAAPVSAEPLFWYRPRSDDGYEGPLHNSRVGDVRKASGAWVPLFAGTAPVSVEPVGVLECHASGDGTFHPDQRKVFMLPVGEYPLYTAPVAAQAQPTRRELDMAMLIKNLARQVRRAEPYGTNYHRISDDALDALKRWGLEGSPLRRQPDDAQAQQPVSGADGFDAWVKREYPHLGPIGDCVVIAREAWSAALAQQDADKVGAWRSDDADLHAALSAEFSKHSQTKPVIGREALVLRCVRAAIDAARKETGHGE